MVATDALTALITRIFNYGLTFVVNLILARILGAAGMGIWAVIFAFMMMISQFFGPGIGFSNIYYVAQKKYDVGETWAATIVLGFGFGVLAILAGIALIWFRFPSLAGIKDQRLALLILLSLPLDYIQTWGIRIIQGMNRIGLMNLLETAGGVIRLCFLIIFVVILKSGVWGAVIAHVGYVLASTMVLMITFKVLIHQGEFRLNWKVIRSNLIYGFKMYIGNLSGWANNRIDMLIAPLFLTNFYIGQYAIAVAVTEKIWMIPDAMTKAVFPRISADPSGRPELTANACRLSMILMVPIALLLASIGWWLFPTIFGPQFQGSYAPMLAILPGALMLGISRILTASLAGTNQPLTLSGVVATAAIVNIFLNFLLIPHLGVVGCALASSGSYTFQTLLLLWFHCKHHNVSVLSLVKIQSSDLLVLLEQSRWVGNWLGSVIFASK